MYKRSIFLALCALLAIAAVVAGCGGGGSSSSSTSGETGGSTEAETGGSGEESGGAAPTKAAFIKEADAVCAAAEEELNAEINTFAKENNIKLEKEELTESQQEELFQELVLPNIAKQGEELAALTPPEGEESTVEDLTDTLSKEVEEAEEEGGVNENALAAATKKAKAYGLKVCGS